MENHPQRFARAERAHCPFETADNQLMEAFTQIAFLPPIATAGKELELEWIVILLEDLLEHVEIAEAMNEAKESTMQ